MADKEYMTSQTYSTIMGQDTFFVTVALGVANDKQTISKHIYIESPTATDVMPLAFVPFDATITRISHITDTGTVTWNANERFETSPESSGSKVYSSDEVAGSILSVDTSFSDSSMAAGSWVYYVASAVSGSPTKLWITITLVED